MSDFERHDGKCQACAFQYFIFKIIFGIVIVCIIAIIYKVVEGILKYCFGITNIYLTAGVTITFIAVFLILDHYEVL